LEEVEQKWAPVLVEGSALANVAQGGELVHCLDVEACYFHVEAMCYAPGRRCVSVKIVVEVPKFGVHVEGDGYEQGACFCLHPSLMIQPARLGLRSSSEDGSSGSGAGEVLVVGPPRVVQVPHSEE
jgi:hypothetical protein